MLDFLIVWSEKNLPQILDNNFTKNLKNIRSAKTDSELFWQPPLAQNAYVWVWGTNVEPYASENQILQDFSGIKFFNGWIINSSSNNPIKKVGELKGELGEKAELSGEYAYISMNNRGDGFVRRNSFASSQIYYYRSDDLVIIASKAGLVSAMLRYDLKADINPEFARFACSASIDLNFNSIYKNVELLPQNASISFTQGKPNITVENSDMLHDERLISLYANDEKTYWDEAFEKMLGSINVLNASDAPLDLYLNGSKDMRLLFALINKAGYAGRIRKIIAKGPDFSPDVRVAKILCEHYGLPLELRYNPNEQTPEFEPLIERLAIHMKISEGEISPLDMFWRNEVQNSFTLPLQEVGLRNISGKTALNNEEQLRAWFELHFAKGDNLGILNNEIRAKNIADLEQYVSEAIAQKTPLEQIPTRHRIERRMAHWNARLWGANNSIGFAPNLFSNEAIVKYAYNAGAKSRILEEFYFEMLKRCDAELIKLPFASQTWERELLEKNNITEELPKPLSWDGGVVASIMRPTQLAIFNHFETIKAHIIANAGDLVNQIVDLDEFAKMHAKDLKIGHLGAIWQLIQLGFYDKVSDITNITTESEGVQTESITNINNFTKANESQTNALGASKTISILGSCVTRDIFDLSPIENVKIARYIARSSLLSMFSPKLIEPTDEMLQSTKWRDRMQVLDLNKGGIDYLFSQEFDYLLIDLIDERLGIITDGVGATSIAPFVNDPEFMNQYGNNFKKLMPFHNGYFEKWKLGLQQFTKLIKQKNIADKIILNKILLTSHDCDGNLVAGVSTEFVEKMNAILKQMYAEFEAAIPNLRVIEYGERELFIDAEHRWGAAPFHYDLITYKHAAKTIAQIIGG